MTPIRLHRRRFLAGVSGTAGAVILAACGGETPATSAPTTAPVAAGAATAPAAATTAATRPAMATTGATTAPAAATMPAANATTGGVMMGNVKSQINAMAVRKGGTLIEGGVSDVRTFNPVLQTDTTSGLINDLVYNGLVDVDPDTLQPVPALAEKFETSADGKTYTFTLRQGVKWHDGSPFTADDVKFSYESGYMNGETGTPRAGTLKERIAGIEVRDPRTVVFTLKDVVAPFLVSNATYAIISKKAFEGIPPKEWRTAAPSQNPVGTGPFKFKSYKQGDNVTLDGNPDYFRGATALGTYIYKVVKDSSVLAQQLKTGEADFGAVSADAYEDVRKSANVDVLAYDSFSMNYMGYNLDMTKTTLFQDVKVRQALFYAIDREAVAAKIYNGLTTVAIGTQPVLSWAYQPDKITTKFAYDTKRAEALLDEAGWRKGADGIRAKDGKRLSFALWSQAGNKPREQYGLVLQEGWKAIGVEMTPKFEEFSVFLERLAKFDFDMILSGFSWGTDPDQQTMWDSKQKGVGFNRYSYKNERVDMLLAEGLRTLDVERRKAIYLEVQNLVLADAPALASDFPKSIAGVSKRVKNRIPNAVSSTYAAHLWYVTDGK